jgi:hypothetical protein
MHSYEQGSSGRNGAQLIIMGNWSNHYSVAISHLAFLSKDTISRFVGYSIYTRLLLGAGEHGRARCGLEGIYRDGLFKGPFGG